MTVDEAIASLDTLAEARARIKQLEHLFVVACLALTECGIAAAGGNSQQALRSASRALEEIGPELKHIRSKAHADVVPADWH